MGSGAFLVEACRALSDRLVRAWARWPETRPKIPEDEDEPLHARRLVAQPGTGPFRIAVATNRRDWARIACRQDLSTGPRWTFL